MLQAESTFLSFLLVLVTKWISVLNWCAGPLFRYTKFKKTHWNLDFSIDIWVIPTSATVRHFERPLLHLRWKTAALSLFCAVKRRGTFSPKITNSVAHSITFQCVKADSNHRFLGSGVVCLLLLPDCNNASLMSSQKVSGQKPKDLITINHDNKTGIHFFLWIESKKETDMYFNDNVTN